MRSFGRVVAVGCMLGGLVGLLTGLELAGANYMWESPRDLALLLAWSTAVFAGGGAVIGCLAAFIGTVVGLSFNKILFGCVGAVTAVFVFMDRFGWCYPCHQFFDKSSPHLIYTPAKSLMFTVAIGLVSVGLGAGAGVVGLVIRRYWRSRPVRYGLLMAAAGGLATATVMSYLATPDRGERAETVPAEVPVRAGGTHRLVLIVDEALTWDVIDPLLEKGRLPVLRKLIDNGVRGDLATGFPTLSHPLLTTVATGRSRARHGIGSKINYAYPGMVRGVSTFPCPYRLLLPDLFFRWANLGFGGGRPLGPEQRRVKAVWNILGEAGIDVGVVGWRCTWPAERVRGFMVSRRLDEDHPTDYVFPADEEPTVHQAVEGSPAVPIGVFTTCSDAGILSDQRSAPRLSKAKRCLEDDLKYQTVAKVLDADFRPEFLALGLLSMDCISHEFYYDYTLSHSPGKFPLTSYLRKFTSPDIVTCLGGVIDSAYAFHDSLIGTWIDESEDGTAYIIASDHGFEMEGSNHYYKAPGIIILYGGPFRRGTMLTGASIYDIAPTVLYLMGLPVPEHMEGRVLAEAIDPAWLKGSGLAF